MICKIAKKLIFPVVALFLAIFSIMGNKDTITERSFFDKPVLAAAFILLTAVSALLWLFGGKITSKLKNTQKLFKKIFICCICAFLSEQCLFNFTSLYNGQSVTSIPLSALLVNDSALGSERILLQNADTITINGEGANVRCIQMNFTGDDQCFKITCKIKDDNSTQTYATVASARASTQLGTAQLTLKPYGTVYSIELRITELEGTLECTGLSLLSSKPFYFNYFRMFLLLTLLIFAVCVKHFGLMRFEFNAKKPSHQIALWLTAFVCAFSMLYYKDPEAKPKEYPLNYIANSDPYSQMYDSLEKGISYIDVEVLSKLLEIDNVYDYSQRESAHVPYLYDRALYNGKYYSYFGIAPTLTFWKPYAAIFGKLPSLNTAYIFASFISCLALFGAISEFLKRYAPKVSLIMLFIALISSVFLCQIPLSPLFGNIYNIAPAFGTMYLLLTLFFGFAAVNSKRPALRCIFLAISGICFPLCIASRPSIAVGAIILIPAFISMLRCGEYSIKEKISGAFSFALPIIIGLLLIGRYNAERFGSPFDFGASYQLTVCDVTKKSLDLTDIPAAIYIYFFVPIDITGDFPFIAAQQWHFLNYGHYSYVDSTFGVFCFLPILLGVAAISFVLRRKNTSAEKKWVYLLGIASTVFVAFVDFCYGGSNLRYILDILPILTLISTATLLECHNAVKNNHSLATPTSVILAGAFAQAVALYVLYALSVVDAPLLESKPEIYEQIKNLVVFWR